MLDLTLLGRHEDGAPGQPWVGQHDRYDFMTGCAESAGGPSSGGA